MPILRCQSRVTINFGNCIAYQVIFISYQVIFIPIETLVLLLSGMPCLLTLPNRRSIPTKRFKPLGWIITVDSPAKAILNQ